MQNIVIAFDGHCSFSFEMKNLWCACSKRHPLSIWAATFSGMKNAWFSHQLENLKKMEEPFSSQEKSWGILSTVENSGNFTQNTGKWRVYTQSTGNIMQF